MPRPAVICLTPVKNEEWILDSFMRAASLWADRIIVADQGSTDRTREIAASFAKAHVIENPVDQYDEGSRQRLLIDEARRLADGPQVLLTLDADEALSAHLFTGPDWQRVLTAEAGTVIRFPWANLAPGGRRAWMADGLMPFGYIDDGAEHGGEAIHSARVPMPRGAPELVLPEESAMLHRQYLDWERMKAKQRWYQAWEWVEKPERRPLDVYRQYHHMDAVTPEKQRDVPDLWLDAYRDAGIDLATVPIVDTPQYDGGVLDLLAEHGADRFRRLAIWDVDWAARARQLGKTAPPGDPRNAYERAVHRWLKRTQGRGPLEREVYWVEKALRASGW